MSGETVRYILLVKKGENSKIGYLFSSYFILKYSCSLPLNAFERNVQCSNFPRNLFSLSPWTIFATVSNIAQWPVSNQNNNIKDSWHLLTSIFDDSTSQYDKFYALWKSLYRWNDLLQKKNNKKNKWPVGRISRNTICFKNQRFIVFFYCTYLLFFEFAFWTFPIVLAIFS